MKKRFLLNFAIAIVTLAMLFACGLALAEGTYSFDNISEPFMYASNDSSIWIISGEHVSVYDIGDMTAPVAEYSIAPAGHVYASSEGLYVYREDGDAAHLELLDEGGSVVSEWAIPAGVYVQQFVISEGRMVAAARESKAIDESLGLSADTMLYVFSLSDGTGQYALSDTVHAVAAGASGDILCLYNIEDDATELGIWSAEAGGISKSYKLSGMGFSAILQHDNYCYLLSDMGIHRLDMDSGTIELSYPSGQNEELWRGIQRAGEYIITEDFQSATLKRFSLNKPQAAASINLINLSKYNDVRINAAIEMFNKAHPDVKVGFIDVEKEKLSTALMAGEPGYDIISVMDHELINYRKSNIVEDLSECASIREGLAHWHDMPYIIGKDLDAIPLYVYPKIYPLGEGARAAIENAGIPEQFASWEELISTLSPIAKQDGRCIISGSKRFPEIYDQYITFYSLNGEVNFDTDLFKENMLLFKKAYEEGLIPCDNESDGLLENATGTLYVDEADYILPPLIDGETIYPTQTQSLIVSKTSAQKDLAKELLGYYTSPEAQSAADVSMMSAGLLKDASLYKCWDDSIGYPSIEQVAFKAKLFAHAVIYPRNLDFNLYAGDRIELFMDGQITVDQLAAELNEKYRMVQMG